MQREAIVRKSQFASSIQVVVSFALSRLVSTSSISCKHDGLVVRIVTACEYVFFCSVVEVELSTETLALLGKAAKSAFSCLPSTGHQPGSSSLIETATAATCLDQTAKATSLSPSTLESSIPLYTLLTRTQTHSIMAGDPRALLRQVGRTSKLSHKADN